LKGIVLDWTAKYFASMLSDIGFSEASRSDYQGTSLQTARRDPEPRTTTKMMPGREGDWISENFVDQAAAAIIRKRNEVG